MDINRFTEKAQESLHDAQKLAARGGQQQVEAEHLLLALLDQQPGLASSIRALRTSTRICIRSVAAIRNAHFLAMDS